VFYVSHEVNRTDRDTVMPRTLGCVSSESMEDLEVLTWPLYGSASKDLALMVSDDGFKPDLILSIARGGLLIAGSLAYALGVKNLHVMNVEYYTGRGERLEFPVILPPPLTLVDLESARVLIADDVADTGHTLAMVRDYVSPQVGEVRTAVIYQKPISVMQCDYVWRHTDKWIDFPWSTNAALVNPHGSDSHS
jgi:hypoxanthine phosphoribosyltransferase